MKKWRLIAAGCAVLGAGCATDRNAEVQHQTQRIRRGAFLLSDTNAEPGQTYELRVYVVAAGDTVAKIAQNSEISVRDFMAINPGLDPRRLVVGQKVRVYEKPRE